MKLVMWAYYLSSKMLEFREMSANVSVSIPWTPVIRAVYSVSEVTWLHLSGQSMPNVDEGFDMNIIALHATSKLFTFLEGFFKYRVIVTQSDSTFRVKSL